MALRRIICATLIVLAATIAAAKPKPCFPAEQAAQMLNKDVCVSAHIYDVVQLPDGTRFLDVCSPTTSDEQCRFTVVSYREDSNEVGELKKYRDMDVQIRGIVQPMHGRAGMVLSHARQFYGGPPKFKPNPAAGARLQRRAGTAAGKRPQPAPPGRAPRVYEYQGSGDAAGQIGPQALVKPVRLRPFIPQPSHNTHKIQPHRIAENLRPSGAQSLHGHNLPAPNFPRPPSRYARGIKMSGMSPVRTTPTPSTLPTLARARALATTPGFFTPKNAL